MVLSAKNLPDSATFVDHGNGTGTFNFNPDYSQADTYFVTFIAFDGDTTDSETDSEVVQITVQNVSRPPVLDPIGSKQVEEGENLNFTVSATDPDGTTPDLDAFDLPANATFVDNHNGTGTFDFEPDYSQAKTYNVTFTATATASDDTLTDSENVTITVSEATGSPATATIADSLTPKRYRMISMPLKPTDGSVGSVLDEIAKETYKEYWRLARWDPRQGDGRYEEKPNTLVPGYAYWLVCRENKLLSMTGTTIPPDRTIDGKNYYGVQLYQGWNQIGVPFNYDIDFAACKALLSDVVYALDDNDSPVEEVCHHYRSTGDRVHDAIRYTSHRLEPGDGYWVWADSNCHFLFSADQYDPFAKPQVVDQVNTDIIWEIRINAACGEYADGANHFGIKESASIEHDDDFHEPPPISNYVSVVFDSTYTTDYRPDAEEGATWHLSVRTNVDDMVNLTFDYVAKPDYMLNLLLTDLHSTREMMIDDGNTYRYDSRGQDRDFEITVVGKGYQPSSSPPLPEDFQLHVNYPNPFNAETVISFEIPQTADVTLTISNALGQQVRVIEMPHLGRGTHEFTWNGRDADGNPVASGVYFYTLSAGDFTASRKMVLLK